MPIPTNLTTNEVKDSVGTEVEFNQLSVTGRSRAFLKVNESPGLPHRITISHQENGSGTSKRRRSVVRVDLSVTGAIDVTKVEKISFYIVGDIPIGNLTATTNVAVALANLLSFCASQGASTTILYDCSGYGAGALIAGSL